MKLTYPAFLCQLTGARVTDDQQVEESLWQEFAFDDSGAYHLDSMQRLMQGAIEECDLQLRQMFLHHAAEDQDWSDVKNNPGYCDQGRMIQ